MTSTNEQKGCYELLDHTADLKIRVRAKALPTLFENAGYALFDLICNISAVQPTGRHQVKVEGADLEELLVSWLGELLYLFEVHGLLLRSFSVKSLDGRSLAAEVAGEPYDPNRHQLKVDIKAVTYHQLEIARVGGEWQTAIVFDI